MTDWCHNETTITGPTATVTQVLDTIETAGMLCAGFIAPPSEADDAWPQWHQRHWGTKWDVHIDEIEFDHWVGDNESTLRLIYDTAQLPLAPLWQFMADTYEGLTITNRATREATGSVTEATYRSNSASAGLSLAPA